MQRPLSRVISPSSSRVYIDLSCERATSRGSPSATDPSPSICITVLHLPPPRGPLVDRPRSYTFPLPADPSDAMPSYIFPSPRVTSFPVPSDPPPRVTSFPAPADTPLPLTHPQRT